MAVAPFGYLVATMYEWLSFAISELLEIWKVGLIKTGQYVHSKRKRDNILFHSREHTKRS